jgi:hypothetical protein
MKSLSEDAQALLKSFDSGALVRPDAAELNVVDLALAVAGVAGATDLPESPGLREIAGEIGEPEHLVFVAVDGLGMNFVDQLPAESFLRSNIVREINSPFPSTTSVTFTTIATGLWPAQHGVTSWFTHVAEIEDTATVLPYVRTRDGVSLWDLGLVPQQVFPAPALTPRFASDTLFIYPEGIVGSVYSRYQSGGTPAAAYDRYDLRAASEIIVDRVRGASEPTFTSLYTDVLDMAAHAHGSSSYETWNALANIERALGDLASELNHNSATRMVVTSDHGHLDAPEDGRYFIEPGGPFCEMTLCRPAGDARVLYLHVKPGRQEEFQDKFRDDYGEGFFLLSTDEVEQLHLLGPSGLSPITRKRMGDFTAIARKNQVIDYRPASEGYPMASVHSGLSREEMRIPLILA